jgi:8-hydroxy-5-deazaflavin:NADPH oxidoreductase
MSNLQKAKMSENGSLAVIGGTGALGTGLAWRLARAGHRVVVGSRSAERAASAADEIKQRLAGKADVAGMSNADAAAAADAVFITVPFGSHEIILKEIRPAVAGKIVVDATVPLLPPKVATFHAPPDGSAALAAQALLGDQVRIVSALHNVAAHKLNADHLLECDVLVFSDDIAARQYVVELLKSMGLRAIHAGALANSVAAEAMTSILIGINKRYKVDGAGIRITGELTDPASS